LRCPLVVKGAGWYGLGERNGVSNADLRSGNDGLKGHLKKRRLNLWYWHRKMKVRDPGEFQP
jgi:hypothetical protein